MTPCPLCGARCEMARCPACGWQPVSDSPAEGAPASVQLVGETCSNGDGTAWAAVRTAEGKRHAVLVDEDAVEGDRLRVAVSGDGEVLTACAGHHSWSVRAEEVTR